MPAKRWAPVSADEVVRVLREQGSIRHAARELGITGDTLRAWAKREGVDLSPYKYSGSRPPDGLGGSSPEDQFVRDAAMEGLKRSRDHYKKLYEVAVKRENVSEELLAAARTVMGGVRPTRIVPPRLGRGETVEDAILGWADWHGGERIDYDVMQGFNAYDPVIMCRRAQYTVDHTLEILFGCHSGTTFERLFVFDLGDGVAGDLLDDNKATNAMGVFESMRLVTVVKSAALTELSAYLPVVYVAVPGNHARRTPKMPWKQPSETADWLMAKMIADRCAGNERITCVVPNAWTAGVTVRGWNHSLNHGYSAAKGGYGGISFYAFQRADGKKTALESAHGQRIHHRWYGHIHTPAELPKMDGVGTQHIVGSLKGGDEYALEQLNTYNDPVQKLVGCHEKYGVTWRYPLEVKHADETPSRYEEAEEVAT